MIAKFLLRRLPGSADQDSLSFALEAAGIARHARPHDWAHLRDELASAADAPGGGSEARSEGSAAPRGLAPCPQPSLR